MQLEYWRFQYKFIETVQSRAGRAFEAHDSPHSPWIKPGREEEMKLKLTLNLFIGDGLTK